MLKIKEKSFLFEELVKRDFKQKYKRTVLGMAWSLLYPILNLIIMRVIFTNFFGRTTQYYTTYLFAGNLAFAYFREATIGGMNALISNASIFSKVNMPKYLFVFSKNVSALLNFLLNFLVFILFVIIDGVPFSPSMLLAIVPIFLLAIFNVGMGLILSALYIFFRDISYIYDVFTTILMYASAIFYTTDSFSAKIQKIFLCNPLYVYIKFIRTLFIGGSVPSIQFILLAFFYAAAAFGIGCWIYKKYNHTFLYYV